MYGGVVIAVIYILYRGLMCDGWEMMEMLLLIQLIQP